MPCDHEPQLKEPIFFRFRSADWSKLVSMKGEAARVVVVEDEPSVREAIERALADDGLTVTAFSDFADPAVILRSAPDLAVIDVVLPHGNGFDLARELRTRRDVPVVFVTARDAIDDRLRGFSLGADDYLVKPFALEELLARVRAVLHRTGRVSTPLVAGDVLLDEQAGFAQRNGRDLELTATELRLLSFLMRHRGAVLSKPQLLTQVWGYDAYDHNLVEVHVSALRRKLERYGPRVVETVHGLGYRLSTR
jgi:DNA-binding response OmpR family regulator